MSKNCATVSGSNLVVRIKEETEFGISENTGFETIYVKSNSINFSQNEVESELLTAGRSPSRSGKGNVEVGGSVEIAIDNKQTGFWLKMVTGEVETITDYIPGKNLHSFKITDTCLNSFQIEKSLLGSDVNYKAVGLKANSLGIEFGGEGELIGTVEVLGKNEFFSTVQDDNITGSLSIDYNINTKNITLVDATGFEEGEAVVLKIDKGALAGNSSEGFSVIELGVGEGSNFSTGSYISLTNTHESVYQVKAVSVDKLYLSRTLEEDVLAGAIAYDVTETNMIDTISGNDIVLKEGIKQSIVAASDFILSSAKTQVMNGLTYDNLIDVGITSVDGSVITASVETLSFNFSNNIEAKRLLADKGVAGRLIEGKAKIEADMNILFDAKNARFLEEAKAGKEFDVTLTFVNTLGDMFKIIMPKGTLTPQTPEISSPTSISVTVKYTPFKTDTNEAIEFQLLNEVASY